MSTITSKPAVAVESWNFDPAHSRVGFRVRHMMLSRVNGTFRRWSGSLALGGPGLADSRVEIEIDAASLDTGESQRDAHLRSADFFDVERFPAIRYRSRRVEPAGGNRYRIVGDLTIRDVTREVALEVEDEGRGKDPWGNQRAAFSAKGWIDRRDFGLVWNQALETGGVLVGEKVEFDIEMQATKA